MHSSRPFSDRRTAGAVTGALIAMLWCAGAAFAQTADTKKGAPSGGGDAGLRERVEQLEGQIVDLQVVIGTLESLARTGGGAAAPVRSEASGGFTGDSARLDSLETQIRALTAQVEQLAAEMRAGGGPQRRSDAGGVGGFDDPPQTSRFGSTTVTSDHADPMDGFGDSGGGFGGQGIPPPPVPGAGSQGNFGGAAPQGQYGGPTPPSTYGSESLPPPGGGGGFAAVEPGGFGGSPKQLYETAYGHLLQQDYGAAQAGFRDFLKEYPQDALAPNALYWLGESHYVQRNYADAAEAFDLVVSTYGSSSKAPDAQLKRGMSLAQLGKRQDACTTLRGVASKFPNAPVQLKAKADSERQRIGCP